MPTNMKIYCKVVNIPKGVYYIMMAVILSTKFKIDAAGGWLVFLEITSGIVLFCMLGIMLGAKYVWHLPNIHIF